MPLHTEAAPWYPLCARWGDAGGDAPRPPSVNSGPLRGKLKPYKREGKPWQLGSQGLRCGAQ